MGGKAILIVTIGAAFILGYIGLNISTMATRTVGNMSWYASTTESHNLATTGANVGLAKFYQDTSWFGSITQSFTPSESSATSLAGTFAVSNEDLGGGVARMRSVSSYPLSTGGALHDTVEVYFNTRKSNSFTLFAWMTNFEGNVFWITADTVWGRVHSNGNLHMNGKPVFYEKVTTSKGIDPKPGVGSNKAVFKQGYETGIAEIQLPNDLSEIQNAANNGGRFYTGDIWVVLSPGSSGNDDGVAYIRTSQLGPNIDTVFMNDGGFNGVIMGDSRVNVFGTLDGSLTVSSLEDIYIQDNVVYADRNYSSTDDILGLVADDFVVVADNTANRNNCEIDGSIFARDDSFRAENHNTGSPRGTLKVTGSIVQDERGAVGTFQGSMLKTGYSKRYYYDRRLADPNVRPPYYPGFWVRSYSIANWWESVRIPTYAE
jgi:hypothetical protein